MSKKYCIAKSVPVYYSLNVQYISVMKEDLRNGEEEYIFIIIPSVCSQLTVRFTTYENRESLSSVIFCYLMSITLNFFEILM
jgi:hypothetical protein